MLPEPTLRRLPWYLAYVSALKAKGTEYVSTTQMSRAIDVDAAQIAKDLSHLSISGRPRIGYEVRSLEATLLRALGFGVAHTTAVIGVGSLGAALVNDIGLRKYGMNIVAGFDVNPAVVGNTIHGIDIHHISELADIRRRLDIEIAVLTVPVAHAQQAADAAMDAGISGIWNFTPHHIRARVGVVVQNALFYANLAVLYNQLENVN